MDFQGKTVLITGGGAGIGRATAEAFGKAGAAVVVVEKLEKLAVELRESLDGLGAPNTVVVADATDPQTAVDVAARIESEHGGLDVLVNNVGDFLRMSKPFESTTDEDIALLYAVNIGHVFTMTRACIPLLRKRAPGSSIISVSSIEGFRAMPNGAIYGAFKAAVTGFTQSLALELGHEGIRVNLIAPETTDSRQVPLDRIIPDNMKPLAQYWIPQGRFGVPDDHAGAIMFLASPLAAWVNGTALHVDGGAHAAGGWYRSPGGGFTNMPVGGPMNMPGGKSQ
jgi:3-oxoacyl-[acyl-carrier protein] reductase